MNQEKTMGKSKIERYGWTVQDGQGELRSVSKHDLTVDYASYQRMANYSKTLLLARDWSWIACGALIVASRDGKLHVVDGGHRLVAAMKRDDITVLPCVVFKTQEIGQEAKGFLQANTARKPITIVDTFRASLIVKDPAAVLVNDLLETTGMYLGGGGKEVNSVRCVGVLIKHARSDSALLQKMWPLFVQLHATIALKERIVDGLMYLEKNAAGGASLLDSKWKARLLSVGAEELIQAAGRAAAFYTKGGARVWATGMLEAINKGHRNRFLISE